MAWDIRFDIKDCNPIQGVGISDFWHKGKNSSIRKAELLFFLSFS